MDARRLGWSLRAVEDGGGWDGLLGFCTQYLAAHPEYLSDKYIARWHRAALAVRAELGTSA